MRRKKHLLSLKLISILMFTSMFNIGYAATEKVPVTGINLWPPYLSALTIGHSVEMIPVIEPSNATNQNLLWASSNESVVTVSSGKITAVAEGTATITVTTEDGGFTATSNITVIDEILIAGLTISPKDTSIQVGETAKLTATITPSNATNRDIMWIALTPEVATVDQNGLVTAVSPGLAKIHVMASKGSATNTAYVTVYSEVPVTSVNLSPEKTSLFVGNEDDYKLNSFDPLVPYKLNSCQFWLKCNL